MPLREEYLRAVASQIRVKRAREPLTRELRAHLLDQEEAFLSAGLAPKEAEARAVSDMGDALLVGGELDRAHRPKPSYAGLAAATAFTLLGLFLYAALSGFGLDAVGGYKLWATAGALGIILLLSLTDYSWWTRLAIPACALWLFFCLFRVCLICDAFHSPPGALYRFGPRAQLFEMLVMVSPQMIAAAAPALLSMLICRLRGKGWSGLLPCALFCLLAFALSLSYRNTGYDANAMGLITLICPAILTLSARKGFFCLNRKLVYAVSAAIALYPMYTFLSRFLSEMLTHQPYLDEYVYPLLRGAKLLGQGVFPAMPEASEINLSQPEILIYAVYRFGYLPVFLFALCAAALLIHGFRRFRRMENRMGALIGLSATATLAFKCLLYALDALTNYTCSLCLPLVSYGNAMMLLDAILVGLSLSCLRGEALPEPERARAGSGKTARSNVID